MPPVEDHAQLASDAELITRVRAGDRGSFGDLYGRHASAALSLARQFSRSPAEADDLVSEAFARVLDGLLEGKGPDTAFRAYLFTTLRNTAYDRTRKDKRLQFSDDMESHDVAVEADDPVIADLEKGLVGRAFAGLPERWQTVLWHMQVEGQSAAEVGVLLGMAPNAVSSLAFRAREGLREAYLQAHLAETAAERCRTTVDRLGAWTRGGLSKREKAQVDAHLQECDRCPVLAAELLEINTGLRGLLAPLLLGGAATGYLATLGPVAPLAQLGVLAGGKAAAVGGKAAIAGGKGLGGHLAAGFGKLGSLGPAGSVAGVAAAAAVVVAGVAIALSSSHSSTSTADVGSSQVTPITSSSGAGANGGGGNGGNGGGGNNNGASGPGGNANGAGGTGGTGGTKAGGSSAPGNTGPGNTGPGSTPSGATNGNGGSSGVPPAGGTPGGTGILGGSTSTPGVPGIVIPTTPSIPITPTVPNSVGIGGTIPSTAATSDTTGPVSSTDTDQSTTDQSTTDQSTTEVTPTSPGTSSSPVTTDPGTGSTTPPDSTPDTTPATTPPVTTPPDTTPDTTPPDTTPPDTTPPDTTPVTTPTTTPLAPANLTVSAPDVSAVVAGGQATVSVTVTNDGGLASGSDQVVGLSVPAGLTIVGATVTPAAPGLRTFRGYAFAPIATVAIDCTQTGTAISCPVPAVDPGSGMRMTITLDVSADADDGDIVLSFNGSDLSSGTFPVKVPAGYATATISSRFALGAAAVNRVTFAATLAPGVGNAGIITIGSAELTVLDVVGPTNCTVAGGLLNCPTADATKGVQIDVAVAAGATTDGMTLTATDARKRAVPTGRGPAVSTTGVGGYLSVTLAGLSGGPLRAGSTTTATLIGATLGTGITNPGSITLPLALTSGLSIATDPALTNGCTVSGSDLVCTPTDGQAPIFELPIQVSSTASGEQTLPAATLPAGTVALDSPANRPTVDPVLGGYDSVSLLAVGTLKAGSMGSLTLAAVPGKGVTEPGSITFSRQLSTGLLITAATGCTAAAQNYVCTADQAAANPTFTVAVLPGATTANSASVTALLDGGRTQSISPAITVTARTPGDSIDLTGPFAGSMAAAETLYCPTGNSRGNCKGGKLSPNKVVRSITTGTGDVISADLTWAAGSPDPTLGDYNTVTVTIDSGTPDAVTATVTGARPSQISADTSGRMYPRVTDLMNYPALATQLRKGGAHTVLVSNLKAKTSAAALSAMAAWSLSTIWVAADPSTSVQVQTVNKGRPFTASPTNKPPAPAEIVATGPPITDLWFTVWAPDPGGIKTLTFDGGAAIPIPVTGVFVTPAGQSAAVGYALVHRSASPGTTLGQSVAFADQQDRFGPDDLWIGPTLVTRSVSQP